MKASIHILSYLFFSLIPLSVMAQIDLPGCGNEGESACGPGDSEYYANNPGRLSPCDFGLSQSGDTLGFGGTCVSGSAYGFQPRWTQSFNTSWTGWALSQQRYGIGANAPMNYVAHVGTHNSFSNLDGGFSNVDSQDQILSITDQLQLGARYIRLDERYYEGQMRVCHASNDLCAGLTSLISPGRLFANTIKELANWLAQNRAEFVILDLNGDPQGNTSLALDPILTYITASKIVTTDDAGCYNNGATCSFPTMAWVTGNEKQVVIFTANTVDPSGLYTFSRNLFDEEDPYTNDRPSNFDLCEDGSGAQISTHAGNMWPYSSEDRSGSVIDLSPGSFLGFLDESEVLTATQCGYSIIAFDYLNNRSHTYPEDPLVLSSGYEFPPEITTDADNRFASSIWSFDTDDYGASFFPYLKANGRWSTASRNTSLPYACSDAPTAAFEVNPNWHVTTASGPFDGGETECSTEGNAVGQQWHFAHPFNSPQNGNLTTAAAGRTPWIDYKVQPVPSFSVAPAFVSATVPYAGAPPASATIQVGGPPSATVIVNATATGVNQDLSWLALPSSFQLPASGAAAVSIGFSSRVGSLPAGPYFASVHFTIVGGSSLITESSVSVQLFIQSTPAVQLNCPGNTGVQGVPFSCLAALTDPSGGTAPFPGVVTLKQIVSVSGQPVTSTLVQNSSAGTSNVILLDAQNGLSIGGQSLVAIYSGDPSHTPASSNTISVVGFSYLSAVPLSETTSFPQGQPGSASPALQTLTFTNSNFTALAAITCSNSPCWLGGAMAPDPNNPKAYWQQLYLQQGAAGGLAAGTYTANVRISDGVHTPINVPITANVTTAFRISPSPIILLTSSSSVSGVARVAPVSGSNIPFAVTSDRSWLVPDQGGLAPGGFDYIANPSRLPPGKYTANLTVTSTLAASVVIPVTFYVVPPSTVTTNPPGLAIDVDDKQYTSPRIFSWTPGSQHNISTQPSPVVPKSAEYAFQAWSDGGGIAHLVVAPTKSTDVSTWTASFNTTGYYLNAMAAPLNTGTVALNPPSPNGFYAPGTSVLVTAQPLANFAFGGFFGDLNGTANPQSIAMSSPHLVSALFESGVTVSFASSPAGVSINVDGSSYTTPFQIALSQLASHSVTAETVAPGGTGTQYTFQAWSDGVASPGRSFQLPLLGPPPSLTAYYNTQFLLTTSSTPANGGQVSGGGWYNSGQSASVQATANPGFTFSNFSGAVTAASNPVSVVVSAAEQITANFTGAPLPPELVITPLSPIAPFLGPVALPLTISNVTDGTATLAEIVSVTGIKVTQGSGSVSLFLSPPILLGAIGPNGSVNNRLLFNWPSTATRIQFTVTSTPDGGVTTASQTLNVFR